MAKKIAYQEPVDYIPKSIRKELGLGEFSKTANNNNSGTKTGSKAPKKK